ncbi:trehalose 6-phosphatase [Palleronia aestuarii]|uniref:Trehalose 6-phosphate phosphatase n=1 Tax=Palleronia aestuarii TaxID=568105 RepID=A0A2W7NPU2_9RHOB|nr:trehalose-phosphatase [Palleronia aestuarii]PZX15266.1 trehalose 6-phosphatase [Palleronia aestuarii]
MEEFRRRDANGGPAERTSTPHFEPLDLPDLDRTALFLDFDGTLVEIAARPDAVELPPGTETLLARLRAASGNATAIVSGRGLADLERMLPDYDGILVGSHGAERRIEGKRSVVDHGQGDTLRTVRDELAAWTDRNDGLLLEEKPASLVLHYRAAPDREADCAAMLDEMARHLTGFVVRPSKMALELMPETVSKSDAVRHLMETWQGRVPVAIGDDRTDEEMFAVADELGGLAIKVGDGDTSAACRVPDVPAVHDTLARWADRAEDA